jgi:hypothetical protein
MEFFSQSPTMEAIFADSVETGKRSRVYTWKFTSVLLGMSCGPLLCMLLFWKLGDTWTMPEMRVVMLVGLGLGVIPVLLVTQFNDDDTLGLKSEGVAKLEQKLLQKDRNRYDGDDDTPPPRTWADQC